MALFLYALLMSSGGLVVMCTPDEDSLPVRLTATTTSTCSLQPAVNSSNKETLEAVNQLLTEKYGPPCSCGGSRSWSRVAYINMTDPTMQCPSSWTLLQTPVRGCISGTSSSSCSSAVFSVNVTYNRVCGRVIGYQKGSTDAFEITRFGNRGIEDNYVDGLSLTHGAAGSRQHVWTFAAALYDDDPNYNPIWVCECTNTNYNWPYQVPSFIGNNYFCDTGNTGPSWIQGRVYPDDPLWDGQGCPSSSTCCQLNTPPWFCTSLPQATSDNLELRICETEGFNTEDIVVSLVELYVSHD